MSYRIMYPEKRQYVACFLLEYKNVPTTLPEFFPGQPVFAMACYIGTIFNATFLQIISFKSVQCDITFKVDMK